MGEINSCVKLCRFGCELDKGSSVSMTRAEGAAKIVEKKKMKCNSCETVKDEHYM